MPVVPIVFMLPDVEHVVIRDYIAHSLRTLDALHLATWLIARRTLGRVELITTDARLEQATHIA